jgi:hypothetical protein
MRKVLPDLAAAEFTREMTRRFVIAPETMPVEQWLATRGQPRCLAADKGPALGVREISKLVGPTK